MKIKLKVPGLFLMMILIHACNIMDYNETISPDELLQLVFEFDTVNPYLTSSILITAELNDSAVSNEQDISFETASGYFTDLPGGMDNLGKNHTVPSAGLKAQIMLNLDSTNQSDFFVQTSIKDPTSNRKYTVNKRLYIKIE